MWATRLACWTVPSTRRLWASATPTPPTTLPSLVQWGEIRGLVEATIEIRGLVKAAIQIRGLVKTPIEIRALVQATIEIRGLGKATIHSQALSWDRDFDVTIRHKALQLNNKVSVWIHWERIHKIDDFEISVVVPVVYTLPRHKTLRLQSPSAPLATDRIRHCRTAVPDSECGLLVSSWILTSCQPHRAIVGREIRGCVWKAWTVGDRLMRSGTLICHTGPS